MKESYKRKTLFDASDKARRRTGRTGNRRRSISEDKTRSPNGATYLIALRKGILIRRQLLSYRRLCNATR